ARGRDGQFWWGNVKEFVRHSSMYAINDAILHEPGGGIHRIPSDIVLILIGPIEPIHDPLGTRQLDWLLDHVILETVPGELKGGAPNGGPSFQKGRVKSRYDCRLVQLIRIADKSHRPAIFPCKLALVNVPRRNAEYSHGQGRRAIPKTATAYARGHCSS